MNHDKPESFAVTEQLAANPGADSYQAMSELNVTNINQIVSQYAPDEEAQKKAIMGCMRGLLKTVADLVKAEGQLVTVACKDNKAFIATEPLTDEQFAAVKDLGMFAGFGNARNAQEPKLKIIKASN